MPTVTKDHVTDAMARMGFKMSGSVFYRYAVSTGYRGKEAENKATELDNLYTCKGGGYGTLPKTVQEFILSVLEIDVNCPGSQGIL